jgi:hypothetical protein
MITGLLNGLYRDPLFGRPIYHLLLWYAQSFPTTWTFMSWLAPSQTSGPQAVGSFEFLAWAASCAFGLVGLRWLGTKAVQEGKKLREQADKDQSQLEFQEPGWRQMEMMAQQMENLQNYQSVAVGSISSSTVTVAPSITQQQMQLSTILTRGRRKEGLVDKACWDNRPRCSHSSRRIASGYPLISTSTSVRPQGLPFPAESGRREIVGPTARDCKL